ncbi:pilus assembly protein PilP [Haemophilus haemolyticus]|uniref:Competence protein n=1 Tax=Haemophilus haemolyticus TaxID=726 RepID=A0A502JFV4_HAEHA|nr:pilus assembly protein PilP [Haemophilus haemolyticus]NYA25902.1 pilus assembly protein PilP [Haemophilus haemolyticus]TPG96380.1 competence protein [Haemophilus haemolyticus]
MKYWFFLVALFFMNCSWGQDPFDKTQRTHSQFDNAQTVMEQTEIISSDVPNNLCGADENRQAAEIPLNALKLVGVVISKDKAFALLLSQDLQIYSVLEGVDVAQEGYVVTKINQNKVQFMRKLGAQCNSTEQKELSF